MDGDETGVIMRNTFVKLACLIGLVALPGLAAAQPMPDMSLRTLEHGTAYPVLGIAASPSGDTVATIWNDQLLFWNTADGASLATWYPMQGVQIRAVAWSPDGSQIAVGFPNGWVLLLDAFSGIQNKMLDGLETTVTSLAFSNDGGMIAGGDQMGNIYVWNALTGGGMTWRTMGAEVRSLAFSPDGVHLVAAGALAQIQVYLAASEATVRELGTAYAEQYTAVAFSPDGTQLVAGTMYGEIIKWDFATGTELFTVTFAHNGEPVRCLAIGPGDAGGLMIASGGDDYNLRLWDLATGAPGSDPGVLTGHTNSITGIALLGNWGGATSSADGTAKIWGEGGGQPGPTEVSGEIMSQTWTRDHSPYRIVGPVIIPPSETLNIDAGVEVQFTTNVPFIVAGGLNVNGAEMDSVVFHGFDSNWGGIRFQPAFVLPKPSATLSAPAAYLNGVIIEGASAYSEDNNTDNSGGGIYVGYGREVNVNNSVIRNNSAGYAGGGIYVQEGSLWLYQSKVTGNTAGAMGGGIAVAGGSAHLSESGVSGNNAADHGGGIALSGEASLQLWQTGIRNNGAGTEGGGISVYDGSSANLEQAYVTGNYTNGTGGGIVGAYSSVSAWRTVIAKNSGRGGGGAIAGQNLNVNLNFVTVADNLTASTGAAFLVDYSEISVNNSIVWGNDSEAPLNFGQNSYVSMRYSDIQEPSWASPADGVISTDPMFADAFNMVYSLTPGSPAINAADPELTDEDGTRADMGAFFFWQEGMQKRLVLPHVNAEPGSEVLFDIRATHPGLVSADLFFTFDSSVFSPAENFVRWNVFDGTPAAQPEVFWTISGDTVKISLATNTEYPAYLNDSPLMTLAFNVNPEADYGWYGLNWLQSVWKPETQEWVYTNLNEEMVYMEWGGIELQQSILWGDVTMDATVSGADASAILRHVVGLPNPTFDREVADVTGNGWVSSFDAALVLRKVLYPWFQFPVEGHQLVGKPAAGSFASLSWERDGSGWVLRSNTAGIEAGELTLTLPGDTPVTITGDNALAYRQDGTSVQIALVNAAASGILFRVDGVTSAPTISTASFNEGSMTLAPMLPTAFALDQNAPNPFNPSTTIRFALPEASQVSLVVYDLNGRAIRTLATGAFQPGNHSVVWDGMDANGREVASGTYVYRLTTEKGSFVKRMTLAR